MFEPKIPLIAAGVGFVLSFLIGVFSGAAFPVFLLRAVGMAIFFAIGALAVYSLIKKFLPELLENTGVPESSDQQPDFGSMIDMTIGDEEEIPFGPTSEIDADSSESENEGGFLEQEVENDESVDFSQTESEEPASPVIKTAQAVPTSSLQDTLATNGSKVPDSPVTNPKKIGATGLDVLPDLQDFLPEEKTGSDDADESEISIESSGTGFSVPDVSGDAVETETMARAIRTILLKDD